MSKYDSFAWERLPLLPVSSGKRNHQVLTNFEKEKKYRLFQPPDHSS
jgi:hypothetical protein